MGINCSQTINSKKILEPICLLEENEKLNHQAILTLNYSFPQKQILESIKTKLQLKLEQNHPQQPVDPGSPMQELNENTWEDCEFTKYNHSCSTMIIINKLYSNSISLQQNTTLSIKNIYGSSQIFNNQYNQTKKGIMKKSRYNNSDSQSPKSSQNLKQVRFLLSEQMRAQKKLLRTKSLYRMQASKKINTSTMYNSYDQSIIQNIEF